MNIIETNKLINEAERYPSYETEFLNGFFLGVELWISPVC